jgi:hypothetical protein
MDLATAQLLERLARRWNVSKSEALRRAIHAAWGTPAVESDQQLRVLDELQQTLGSDPEKMRRWPRRTLRISAGSSRTDSFSPVENEHRPRRWGVSLLAHTSAVILNEQA